MNRFSHFLSLLIKFGATVSIGCLAAQTSLAAGKPINIDYTFNDTENNDGAVPQGVTVGQDGSVYGLTAYGGTHQIGTAYKIDPAGNETVLHDFASRDGSFPIHQLVFGPDGYLYGVTSRDGDHGGGTVFKISTDGSDFKVIHDFGYSDEGDQLQPSTGLTLASDGYFYGGTEFGGTSDDVGLIYRINTVGEFEKVHSFSASEGSPSATLTQAKGGDLYGATVGVTQNGAIYKLSPGGKFKILHNFTAAEGQIDRYPLLQLGGTFYGVTNLTAFSMNSKGDVSILHKFPMQNGDGILPSSGLALGSDGLLYGTTFQGGKAPPKGNKDASGTLYRMNLKGVVKILHSFNLFGKGDSPQQDSLVLSPNGAIYGSCSGGGEKYEFDSSNGSGTVFDFPISE